MSRRHLVYVALVAGLIAAAVPAAVYAITVSGGLLPAMLGEVDVSPESFPRIMALGPGLVAIGGPLGVLAARRVPAWLVTLTGVTALGVAQALLGGTDTAADLTAVRAAQGLGAGLILSGALLLAREFTGLVAMVLTALWAGALVVGAVAAVPAGEKQVHAADWQGDLRVLAELLAVAMLLAVGLALVSALSEAMGSPTAGRAARGGGGEPTRQLALVLVAGGCGAAALILTEGWASGPGRTLVGVVLLAAFAGVVVGLLSRSAGPWLLVAGVVLGALAFETLFLTPMGQASLSAAPDDLAAWSVVLACVAGLLGAVAVVVGPARPAHSTLAAGLLCAAVGALVVAWVLPDPTWTPVSLTLVAGGVGAALAVVVNAAPERSVAVVSAALPFGLVLMNGIQTWRMRVLVERLDESGFPTEEEIFDTLSNDAALELVVAALLLLLAAIVASGLLGEPGPAPAGTGGDDGETAELEPELEPELDPDPSELEPVDRLRPDQADSGP